MPFPTRDKNSFAPFSFKKHRLILSSALIVFCAVGFATISFFNCERFGMTFVAPIHVTILDGRIPFIPAWIWVYLLYYPFCFLPLLLWEVRNIPSLFQKTVSAFALQFGISFLFFLFLPLRMMHPAPPIGIDGTIIKTLYGFDLGFNSFPSLHLANVTFISCLFLKLRGRFTGSVVATMAFLIAASTLLIKQHYVSDVLLGALLGWGSFAVCFSKDDPVLHPV